MDLLRLTALKLLPFCSEIAFLIKVSAEHVLIYPTVDMLTTVLQQPVATDKRP